MFVSARNGRADMAQEIARSVRKRLRPPLSKTQRVFRERLFAAFLQGRRDQRSGGEGGSGGGIFGLGEAIGDLLLRRQEEALRVELGLDLLPSPEAAVPRHKDKVTRIRIKLK